MSLTLSSTAGSDYIDPVVTMITFGSGVTSATYSVPIVDDSNVESPKTFAAGALLTTAESNMAIVDNNALVTILDDDRKLFLQHIHKEGYWYICGAHRVSDYF